MSEELSRKSHAMAWILAVAIGLLTIGGCYYASRPPSFSQLEASCDDSLRRTPRLEALENWLKINKISFDLKTAPFEESLKGVLVGNGIPAADVDRATTCIAFGNLVVQGGGFFASHIAKGYFVFRADGSLVSYRLGAGYFSL